MFDTMLYILIPVLLLWLFSSPNQGTGVATNPVEPETNEAQVAEISGECPLTCEALLGQSTEFACVIPKNKLTPVLEPASIRTIKVSTKTIRQLKAEASKAKIKGYGNMTKAQLIEALA